MPLQQSPSISPRQMTLLRIVAAMAWSDGHLAQEEVDLMLDRFSQLFASNPEQQQALRQELRDYLLQNIPLEELIPKLTSQAERELVLQLGYDVIRSSARTPDEAAINAEEAEAYRHLLNLLQLPTEVSDRITAEATTAQPADNIIEVLTVKLEHFFL